jgi:hypothetical protein
VWKAGWHEAVGERPPGPMDVMDAYACWVEETQAVEVSYRRWTRAGRRERRLAFAAHLAALDREERAATVYLGLACSAWPRASTGGG